MESGERKPVVTVAKYQDRIVSDRPLDELVNMHGAAGVYIDGVSVADMDAKRAQIAEAQAAKDAEVKAEAEALVAAEAETPSQTESPKKKGGK